MPFLKRTEKKDVVVVNNLESFELIYNVAKEISEDLLKDYFFTAIEAGREKVTNIVKNLELDREEVYNNSPEYLKDIVELLTFVPSNSIKERMELIDKVFTLYLEFKNMLFKDIEETCFNNAVEPFFLRLGMERR